VWRILLSTGWAVYCDLGRQALRAADRACSSAAPLLPPMGRTSRKQQSLKIETLQSQE